MDTAPDLHVALNATLEDAGYPTAPATTTRHWIGHGARAMLTQGLTSAACANLENEVERLLPEFLGRYEALGATHSELYLGVAETLQTLQRQGAKLAVVTNKIARFTHPILEALSVHGYFDAVVCGDTTAQPKPAPDPVHYAMRALASDQGNTLFVGDSMTDVAAARAAEVDVVCVRYGYNQGDDVSTYPVLGVLEKFTDLLNYADQTNS